MASEIRADYQRLDEVANGFQNQADQVNDMLQKVTKAMDPLENGGWIGKGSDAFFEEMNNGVLPSVRRLKEALERASEITRDVSSRLHDAETQAAAYFKR